MKNRALLYMLSALIFFAVAGCSRKQTELKVSERIDVSSFDFSNDVIDLNGPWEFYWEKFLYPDDFKTSHPPVPDGYSNGLKPWNTMDVHGKKLGTDGYATYRLRLILPELSPKMGIRISFQFSSFRLFVNGQEAAQSGSPGTSKIDTVPSRANQIAFFEPEGRTLEIILHIANYYYFRGGLRGFIQLGRAEAVEILRNRKLILDLLLAGFGISIWLYHLFLFLQRPEERSILYFLILAGSFIPRYFFLDERPIALLTESLSLDFEVRMIQSLHILTPSLLMLFMHSIFPESVRLRTVLLFFASTLIYFLTWFSSSQVYTGMLIKYSLFATVAASVLIGIAVFQAVKVKNRAALVQGLGILLFAALLMFAFTGVMQAESSGFLALLAFTSLSFFQALFLSASYSEKMQTNLVMAAQLQESREALAKQREELELNFHDALGGSLTDLKIFTERIRKEIPKNSWPSAIEKLDGKISNIIRTFRTQLLFMEDMELASSELFTGLHMALLRRYSDAGRELNFITVGTEQPENAPEQPNTWLHLFFLVMEICTNDLKYGIGESKWKIIRKENDLIIHQKNKTAKKKKETVYSAGRRVSERTELLGGTIKSFTKENQTELEICLPKFWK
ncbi:MAG TPA: 7TM diverse intracellular signaling domain-containing protein [Leptospiraceae bacterium]|nr:7TM diverse intracellular signaling domain-containing protein [Leptospiraceae bacterium]HNF14243.1 7TM diverse intracellular signaling domain-containing protein [Leptospiraceae bacterium]